MNTIKKTALSLLICALFVSFAALCHAQAGAKTATFTEWLSFKNGTAENELLWLTDEKGYCVCGSLTGPMAFITNPDSSLWAADTQNARLSLFDKTGKKLKIIDLEKISKNLGLRDIAALADIRLIGSKMYAADANNNVILQIDIYTSRTKVINPSKLPNEAWVQLNFLHADEAGRLYVEDLASQKTVVINSAGAVLKVLNNRNGLIVNPKNGNIASLFFDDSGADEASEGVYKIILSSGYESEFKYFAELAADEPVLWVSLVGFDDEGNITAAYETDANRFYNVFSPEGKLIKSFKTSCCDSGYEPMRPDWASNEGKIYNVGAANGLLRVMVLK